MSIIIFINLFIKLFDVGKKLINMCKKVARMARNLKMFHETTNDVS